MKRSARLVAFCCLALALAGSASAQEAKAFRQVPIPPREHGYGNFMSQVIHTQKQFDGFLKDVQGQSGWNARDAFLKAINTSKLDFDKEALVLVRQTEGSGSNKVTFAPPTLKGDKLVCLIQRDVAPIGTADIADYCFAVAVDRAKVTAVDVFVGKAAGKPRETFEIKAK